MKLWYNKDMGKRRKQFDPYLEAEVLNRKTYFNFYDRLSRIALSMFEWEHLPLSMNGEFLEWCLFTQGQAALLYDEKMGGFINTYSCTAGKLNIYRRPIRINCYSVDYNEYRDVYTGLNRVEDRQKQAILVENTVERIPTAPTLMLFAYRMAECQRSEDVNIKQQKFPGFIPMDEKQRLTMINLYKQYDANSPVILGDKNLNLSEYKAVNTEAPYVADKLQEYRQKIWNEALTFLGVNNLNEKKERQINAETNVNNEAIGYNLQAMLSPRQRACRYFNEKYGFTGTDKEISVKIRADLYNVIKLNESVAAESDKMGILSGLVSNPGSDNE